jgi:hypothetical protein
MQSNKISLMRYNNFNDEPLPLLQERIKINLAKQKIDFYTYTDEFKPQPVYLKSRYIDEKFPNYERQIGFDKMIQSLEWIFFDAYGPKYDDLLEKLNQNNLIIDGFEIIEKD